MGEKRGGGSLGKARDFVFLKGGSFRQKTGNPLIVGQRPLKQGGGGLGASTGGNTMPIPGKEGLTQQAKAGEKDGFEWAGKICRRNGRANDVRQGF